MTKKTNSGSSDFRTLLSENAVYIRYRAVIADGTGKFSVEEMLKEATMLHTTRQSRLLYSLRVSPSKLQSAILNDMSNRARLSEMKASLLNRLELIETVMKALRVEIQSRFRSHLDELASNAAQRTAVMTKITHKGAELQSQLVAALAILDVFIKDIDQAAYSLKNTLETLKMLLDKKEGYQV